MKSSTRFPRTGRHLRPCLLALALVVSPAIFSSPLDAQTATRPYQSASRAGTESPKTGTEPGQNEALRHSGSVTWIANHLHVSTETAARIFEDFNSGVLILVIVVFLVRKVPPMFRKRREDIQTALVDARTATEQANERLAAVEQRLSRLDTEIEAIRQQAERDGAGDEARIKQSLEEERHRIVASAEIEIESAGVTAQRKLKQFAAELAIERATRDLRLTPEADRLLVSDFGRKLNVLPVDPGRGGRN